MKVLKYSIKLLLCFNSMAFANAQVTDSVEKSEVGIHENKKILYGSASYYNDKFNGKKTSSGEIFSQKKYTAACNILPLGTWIRVTNLSNGKSVIVKTNDRLHPKMKRVVDLSRIAAEKLHYVNKGLTKVKVEVVKPNTKK